METGVRERAGKMKGEGEGGRVGGLRPKDEGIFQEAFGRGVGAVVGHEGNGREKKQNFLFERHRPQGMQPEAAQGCLRSTRKNSGCFEITFWMLCGTRCDSALRLWSWTPLELQ